MINTISNALCDELMTEARNTPRRRTHMLFHSSHHDPVQRMLIALARGTYVRPHCHPQAHKWEMLVAIRGRTGVLIFDQKGIVTDRFEIAPNAERKGFELSAGVWHTVFPLDDESLILEIKAGPYRPEDKTEFAAWSPEENSAQQAQKEALLFMHWLRHAQVGSTYTSDHA